MSRAVTLAELADQAVFTVDANSNFVGIGSTIPSGKLDVDGTVSATAFVGSGASITGISGFATALSSTPTDPLFHVFKTPRNLTVSTGSSLFIESDAASGNMAFTKMGSIHVSTGSTLHVGSGTTFVTDVLSLF